MINLRTKLSKQILMNSKDFYIIELDDDLHNKSVCVNFIFQELSISN